MPVNTKLILGGAAALALLLSSKSSSKKSTPKVEEKPAEEKPVDSDPNDGKGEAGLPAGPKGCVDGLIVEDGICVVDPNPKGGSGNGGGGASKYNGLSSLDAMYVSADCKVVKFGDKTGDAWWKNKGKPKAKQWVDQKNPKTKDPIYTNSLMIAYEMIRGLTPCFKTFPIQKNFITRKEMEIARISWIKSNREVWNLLWSIRNRIDKEFFGGSQTVELDLKTLKFVYGKTFDFDKFWENFLLPLTSTALEKEMNKPGYLFTGIVKNDNDTADLFSNQPELATRVFIQLVVLSNIKMSDFLKLFDPGLGKYQVFGPQTTKFNDYMQDRINDLTQEEALFGFEAEMP